MKTILKSTLTPITLAIMLTGCAVGPDYQEPMVDVNQAYLYSNQQTIGGNPLWWESLDDTTLSEMVNDVQQQNITIKVAAERIKMASSYKQMVDSLKVPTISLGGGYFNYQLSENDSLLGPVFGAQEALGVSLLDSQHDGGFVGASIAWEADLFGRLDRQSNAANIRVEQAEIYQNGLYTLITADVISNYLQLRGAQERKQLAQDNIEDQRQTLELVEKVVQSGYGSELDLAQAQAALAATQSVIPQLEIAEQVHKHRLAVLLGEPLEKLDVRLSDANGLPQVTGVIPVGMPSELLKRRADIRLAEREMAAINEEVAMSIANRYPKFFLTGAPGVTASDFDDLFSSDSFGWAGSVGVHWNVFDGGRSEALVEMNEARFEAAALNYQLVVDSAIKEVDTTLFAYGRSQENQVQIDKAVFAAQNAVSKAHSLYKAGLIDYLSVLDAQRQERLLQDRQIAARLQSAQATVAVQKAIGGNWVVDEAVVQQGVSVASVN
ncbi:efflux transporter outer membrane subunit [Vibrio astriarenae]|uniref:efflux transporter outer membrane subunit n=1 Tax=Vibrio astriarenae TaxID=1481923 RepID=UPI0037368EAA